MGTSSTSYTPDELTLRRRMEAHQITIAGTTSIDEEDTSLSALSLDLSIVPPSVDPVISQCPPEHLRTPPDPLSKIMHRSMAIPLDFLSSQNDDWSAELVGKMG